MPIWSKIVHPALDAPFASYVHTASAAVTPFGTHVYSDEQHAIAIAGRCIITYSKQPPDAKYFAAWNQAVARLTEQQPGKLSVLIIIDSSTPTPDESSRKLIAATMRRYADSVDHFAYVVEGRGFGAAALRSAISLVNLATRTPFRQKVFATLEEASVWLAHAARDRRPAVDPQAMSSLVHSMRAEVEALAPVG